MVSSSDADKVLLATYRRQPVTFVRGDGAFLYDDQGKQYIDLVAGIAVVSVGHGNPRVASAAASQLFTLGHVSNLYQTKPGVELARALTATLGGWGRAFLCNSGTEANECAIKLVRKWGASSKRYEIICADGGFHGRTMGALAATGKPSIKVGFDPLPGGFIHAQFGDLAAFQSAVTDKTVAILVEPIQGERGVVPAAPEFLRGLRELANINGIALIFDEIQTGIGRTGTWWAFQQLGVTPDIITSAKGLANGFPIGACIAAEPFASAFGAGDHGTTFGGGPVACSAALATIKYLEDSGTLAAVSAKGDLLSKELGKLAHVKLVRGLGLMRGVVFDSAIAPKVVSKALEFGLVLNSTAEDTLRIIPPLVISNQQIHEACSILERAIIAVTS